MWVWVCGCVGVGRLVQGAEGRVCTAPVAGPRALSWVSLRAISTNTHRGGRTPTGSRPALTLTCLPGVRDDPCVADLLTLLPPAMLAGIESGELELDFEVRRGHLSSCTNGTAISAHHTVT